MDIFDNSVSQSQSLSLSMSKGTVLEDTELLPAENDSISNEDIKKGNTIQDNYVVISDAIKGGMGSVWKVHHNSWNTDLAMKRPLPKFFAEGSGERKKDFIHECEAWINLGLHPNIVSCYYVREIGGVPSVFSEWMDNGSLKDRIGDGTLYDGTEEEVNERLLDIAIQFAAGLRYAHGSKDHLIHQDVKPGNLLLTKAWEAKISDFGLSSLSSTGGSTPAYCSPEQAAKKLVTGSTDIYSWAVSVMEMFLGKRMWKSGPEAGRRCREFFPDFRVRMPEEMKELLAGSLDDEPGNRPQDFGIVTDVLKRAYKETTGKDYPREDPETVSNTVGALNNQALSWLDLGFPDRSVRLWEQALALEPDHTDTYVNYSLYLWRAGKITDEPFLKRLDDHSGEAGIDEIYEQFCKERGSSERELVYPDPVTGDSSFKKRRPAAACINGNILSFAVREYFARESFYVILSFDADTGRLIRQYPPEGVKSAIPFSIHETACVLTENGGRLLLNHEGSRKCELWDTEKQKLIRKKLCQSGRAGSPDASDAAQNEFRVIWEKQGWGQSESAMLRLQETATGRIFQSLKLPALKSDDHWASPCPRMLEDPAHKRLIFYKDASEWRLSWYLVPIPHAGSYRMPWRVSHPMDVHETAGIERRVLRCKAAFDKASEKHNTEEMIRAYGELISLPAMEKEEDSVPEMNRKLLLLREPSGLHGIYPAEPAIQDNVCRSEQEQKDRWKEIRAWMGDKYIRTRGSETVCVYMPRVSIDELPDRKQIEARTSFSEIGVDILTAAGERKHRTVVLKTPGKAPQRWLDSICEVSESGRYAVLKLGIRPKGKRLPKDFSLNDALYEFVRMDLETEETAFLTDIGTWRTYEWHISEKEPLVYCHSEKDSTFYRYDLASGNSQTMKIYDAAPGANEVSEAFALSDGKKIIASTHKKYDSQENAGLLVVSGDWETQKWKTLYEGKPGTYSKNRIRVLPVKEHAYFFLKSEEGLELYREGSKTCLWNAADTGLDLADRRFFKISEVSGDGCFLTDSKKVPLFVLEWDYVGKK